MKFRLIFLVILALISAGCVDKTKEEKDTKKPVISLIGGEHITVPINKEYNDMGAIATDNVDGNITMKIVRTIKKVKLIIVENGIVEELEDVKEIDTEIAGEYKIIFSVKDNADNQADEVVRTVSIEEDLIKPVIILNSNSENVMAGWTYVDGGVLAVDNIDGDISSNVTRTIQEFRLEHINNEFKEVYINVLKVDTTTAGKIYIISYNVADSSGNKADEVKRTVVIQEQDITKPIITLKGNSNVGIYTGDLYSDPGVSAFDNIDGDITSKVSITILKNNTMLEKIDTKETGTYTINYNVTDAAGNKADETVRTIKVVKDTEKPIITLVGADKTEQFIGEIYKDAGATAVDGRDGDITKSIVTEIYKNGTTVAAVSTMAIGEYEVVYKASDSSGNYAEPVVRIVKIINENIKPVITLLGETNITLLAGDSYTDAGATANDNKDGDLTSKIVKTIYKDGVTVSAISTVSPSVYEIRYSVTDSVGNMSEVVTRNITVINDNIKPEITLTGDVKKIVYTGTSYVEDGYTAIDNKDGDITSKVAVTIYKGLMQVSKIDTVTESNYTIKYTVKDRYDNQVEVFRYVSVIYDVLKPEIKFSSRINEFVYVGFDYVDTGVSAVDNKDGDISQKITKSIWKGNTTVGAIDTTTYGVFVIKYNVTDNQGNVAEEVVRNVAVMDKLLEFEYTLKNTQICSADVIFSPDGKKGAIFTLSNTIVIFDTDTGKTIQTISTKTGNEIKFSSLGDKLYSYSDGSLIIWDWAMGEILDTINLGYSSIEISDDENYVIASDYYGFSLYDLKNKVEILKKYEYGYDHGKFSPDGKYYVGDYGIIIECSTGRVIKDLDNEYIYAVCWSSDGTRIIFSHQYGKLSVFDVSSGNKIYEGKLTEKNYDVIYQMVCSSDGKKVAYVDQYSGVGIFEIDNLKLIKTIDSLYGYRSIDWSLDGTKILVGGNEDSKMLEIE